MKEVAILLHLTMWIGSAMAQPSRCTPDLALGIYAFAYEGYLMRPTEREARVPIAGLALISIDSQGVISGQGYEGRQSIGGGVVQKSLNGAIQINSDCTGTVDWGGGVTEKLVASGDGQEIYSLQTASSSPPVVTGRWKRISRVPRTVDPAQCQPGNMTGRYVNELHGFILGFPPRVSQLYAMPLAAVTSGSFWPSGLAIGRGIGSQGGVTSLIGINTQWWGYPDCTFHLGHLESQTDVWGVVLDGGNELWGIALSGYLGTWRRIAMQP